MKLTPPKDLAELMETAAKISKDGDGLYGVTLAQQPVVNILDVDAMRLHRPTVKADLPAGGRRLDQSADGYVATIVSGVVIAENGVPTAALPGRLVRGRQEAPTP